MKDILLLTPPFTQLNTPYPATAYLKGFLNTRNIGCIQMDLGLEVILKLFSQKGLGLLFDSVHDLASLSDNARRIFTLQEDYKKTIEEVIAFLQGKNATLARQICSGDFLPQASRFGNPDDLDWAFGIMGFQDKAKHLATLYLEDLSDFIVECIDENFGFSRYAESLGRSANSFDELYGKLQGEPTLVDRLSLQLLDDRLKTHRPSLVGISVPFPGNLYSAFRCADFIRKNYPDIKVSMGGGFPNTELRSLFDSRVFEFFDFITLDDGELPLEILLSNILNPTDGNPDHQFFKRTFLKVDEKVVFNDLSSRSDYKQKELGTPDYSDLPLDRYLSVIEVTNPMHSLWSDGRWNKLTMAHGCYWGKCTFCDGTLDYIRHFEPLAAKTLVDRMEQIIAQTGERGFHFVDEAAPPALMTEVALEILRRGLIVTWWTNIRFEKSFTRELCQLLKSAGCIAVSGGLEVASDRLLTLINKGVTVEQVARVTDHFTEAGIMVHAYLMYGFPSQTIQETVDSLEMVRQLFELNIIQSGFWHHFALTAHSPIGQDPERYGLIPIKKDAPFANNDVQFNDKTGINHDNFSFGLKKSLLNFMNGIGFDLPLQDWFEFRIPKTSVPKNFIRHCLEAEVPISTKPTARILWLGGKPTVLPVTKKKRDLLRMTFQDKTESFQITLETGTGLWLQDVLEKISVHQPAVLTFSQFKEDFANHQLEDFESFWYSPSADKLKAHGLLCL